MKEIIITNNPLVKEELEKIIKVEYYYTDYMEILKKVRDRIHKGHKLLTHPLSGSIKPNETPYKSIMISMDKDDLDTDSLITIENSIHTAKKFIKDFKTPDWSEEILSDFQTIDLTLIKNAIK
ncbi:MAG: GrdX protein [Firmicutes bacterium]|nr:GrdX protein [Bacillota bacterium]